VRKIQLDPDILTAINTQMVVPIWPVAGKALGYGTRSAAYAAAKLGHIPTVQLGHRRPVPTAWLRKVLYLDNDPPPRRRPRT